MNMLPGQAGAFQSSAEFLAESPAMQALRSPSQDAAATGAKE